jgi:hypothetical protein
MAISRFKTSTLAQGLPKYQKLWDGISTPITSAFQSIATLDASGTSSVTFSSIPQGYKHLQIRYIARSTLGTADTYYSQLRFNGATSGYTHAMMSGNGQTPSGGFNSQTSAGSIVVGYTIPTAGDGGTYGTGIIDIYNYSNGAMFTTTKATSGYNTNGVQSDTYVKGGMVMFSGSAWQSTSAVTSIQCYGVDTYSSGSTFALYGIKG